MLICFLLAATKCYSQKKDTTGLRLPYVDGKLTYTTIINEKELNKSDLYKNAKQWFVDTFESSSHVIQSEDKEEGVIVGKGIIPIYHGKGMYRQSVSTSMTIKIECKDGRYRYKIYDILVKPTFGDVFPSTIVDGLLGKELNEHSTFNKRASREVLESLNFETNMLVFSIQRAMGKKTDNF